MLQAPDFTTIQGFLMLAHEKKKNYTFSCISIILLMSFRSDSGFGGRRKKYFTFVSVIQLLIFLDCLNFFLSSKCFQNTQISPN